jgi:hypothetical protein
MAWVRRDERKALVRLATRLALPVRNSSVEFVSLYETNSTLASGGEPGFAAEVFAFVRAGLAAGPLGLLRVEWRW